MDLTTEVVLYLVALKAAAPAALDLTTLVVKDQPTIRVDDVTDLNTAYWLALT